MQGWGRMKVQFIVAFKTIGDLKMYLKKLILANVFLAASVTASYACDIGARVSIVGNEFPAIQTVGAGAQECTGAE